MNLLLWDDFFTRELQFNACPIAYPDNKKVIVNACESVPFRIEKQVAKHVKF